MCFFLCCCFWEGLEFIFTATEEEWTAYESVLDDYSLLIRSQGLSLNQWIAELRARCPSARHWGFIW